MQQESKDSTEREVGGDRKKGGNCVGSSKAHADLIHHDEEGMIILNPDTSIQPDDAKQKPDMKGEPPKDPGAGNGKKKPTEKKPKVPIGQLFRYSTKGDKILMVFGSLCAMAVGCVFPLFTIIFGKVLDILNDPKSISDLNYQGEQIRSLCVYFLIIAIVSGVCCFFENSVPVRVTERTLERVRHEYMKSLLRQDMSWFDVNRGGEATAKVSEATIQMSAGMEKFCSMLKSICTLLCGIIIGFTTSWKLTLVIMGCAPFFAVALTILIVSMSKMEGLTQKAYARAGDVANEVLSSLRIVAAYSGERHEVKRYDRFLADAESAGARKGLTIGSCVGLMLFSFYAMYGVSTYAGAEFIIMSREDDPLCAVDYGRAGCFTGGKVVQTFVAVLLGALSFGNVGPTFAALAAAQAAAAELYEIIDRVPSVDIQRSEGHQGEVHGKIEFRNCTFAYPSRPDVMVLRNFSLVIEPGETVALVGPSGSGKSTIVGLLERFYDPLEGEVLVDDVPVRSWSLERLRDQIGLVQQDPLLFGVSVLQNIAMGSPA
eukprot:CAMPEP_0113704570 /NCGR_PEP_ID=MMETSP0038_2-20120614/26597_1 /TAXON_ID=2898 /ORGANISM="Cryptomonas paramecium" /LENGTH=542 /DNA_ID=CAMNT_0000629375 /DNA_START=25 /DNA_END=1650 /DNA_ORIENTATION=- /assembly_acc=CAM_ASM_000170